MTVLFVSTATVFNSASVRIGARQVTSSTVITGSGGTTYYLMRATIIADNSLIYWTVPTSPDTDGSESGESPGDLKNIGIAKTFFV